MDAAAGCSPATPCAAPTYSTPVGSLLPWLRWSPGHGLPGQAAIAVPYGARRSAPAVRCSMLIRSPLFLQATNTNSISFTSTKGNAFLRLQPVPMRFAVCCAAKKETVDKVCDIVKKQFAVPEGTEVSGASKFSDLGADSLDTVEIVMGLEEEFGISVEESSAQSIATVEDAAALIKKFVDAKSP